MKRVCIDPGHGGHDPGASGHGLREADVALAIAKEVQGHLDGFCELIYTRGTDTFVDLVPRAQICNKAKCHLFVSIHINAAETPEAHGFEVCVYPSDNSRKAGEAMAGHLAHLFTADRGLKERPGLVVLNHTTCPSVLLELGFISNEREAALLGQAGFRLAVAREIANGIKTALAAIQ